MKAYFSRHFQVLFSSLGDILRQPFTSLIVISIIAVMLFMPAALYIAVKSAHQLSEQWQGRPQMTLFMQPDLSADESSLIFNEIKLHPKIEVAEYITKDQALAEFKLLSELSHELDFLAENPLPAAIVVMPKPEYTNSSELLTLRDELTKIIGIDNIKLDLEWVDRFKNIMSLLTKLALIFAVLLAIALISTVGNTITLLITNRRHEIEITKLVGGTNTFVRRPFLYFGSLYGFLGGISAIALIIGSYMAIAGDIQSLSGLYQQNSLLYMPLWYEYLILLFAGVLLGWLAARWALALHLHRIKPR